MKLPPFSKTEDFCIDKSGCNSNSVYQCPHPSHLKLREKSLCKSIFWNYICVKDLYKGDHIEFCKRDYNIQRPGYQVVWSGNFDGMKCEKTHFQPKTFNSSEGSSCIYQKSLCNEVGQVILDAGSTRSDTICGCDYRKGYAFVNKPSHPCFCNPTQEDCSCYLKTCPETYILSKDYNCVEGDDFQSHLMCASFYQSALENERNLKSEHQCPLDSGLSDYDLEGNCRFDSCTALFTVATLAIAIVIQVAIVLLFVKQGKISICTDVREISSKKNSMFRSDHGRRPSFSESDIRNMYITDVREISFKKNSIFRSDHGGRPYLSESDLRNMYRTGKEHRFCQHAKTNICRRSNSRLRQSGVERCSSSCLKVSHYACHFTLCPEVLTCLDSKPKVVIIGRKTTSETIQSLLGVDCLQNFEVNKSHKPDAILLALEFGCLPVDEFMKFLQCLQSFKNGVNFIVVFVSNDEVNISIEECLDKVPQLKYAVEKSEIRCFSYCKTYTHDTRDTQKLQYKKDMKLKLLKAINYCRLNDLQQCDTSHNTEQLLVVQNGVENTGTHKLT